MTDERKKAVMAFAMRQITDSHRHGDHGDLSEFINLTTTQGAMYFNGIRELERLGGFKNFLACCAQELEGRRRGDGMVYIMAIAFTAERYTLRPQMTQTAFGWLEGMLGPTTWFRTYHPRDETSNNTILLNWTPDPRANALKLKSKKRLTVRSIHLLGSTTN